MLEIHEKLCFVLVYLLVLAGRFFFGLITEAKEPAAPWIDPFAIFCDVAADHMPYASWVVALNHINTSFAVVASRHSAQHRGCTDIVSFYVHQTFKVLSSIALDLAK